MLENQAASSDISQSMAAKVAVSANSTSPPALRLRNRDVSAGSPVRSRSNDHRLSSCARMIQTAK